MSGFDDLTDEQLGQMGEIGQQIIENRKLKEEHVADARARGDWSTLLMLADSQERAPVLLDALREVDDEQARALLADWFNSVDAFGELAPSFREQFDRLGFVTDDESGVLPDLPITVYRSQWGSDPEPLEALSWTASREVAERFAKYLTGPRAWFLGIKRDDDEPWIWQATVHEAYAWFTSRNEKEIVPRILTDVHPISKLITVPK